MKMFNLFKKQKKEEKEKLLQIRYYCGEESSHLLGYGIAPGNIYLDCLNIREKFEQFKISENRYFINGNVIELSPQSEIALCPDKKGWGDLVIRLIGNSEENLEQITKKLNLPYNKKAIVHYSSTEIKKLSK